MKKDEQEARHSLKKTDEEIYEDFEFDREHPFMALLDKVAAKYAQTGEPFVLHKRIAVLTDDSESTAFSLYFNDGEVWRQSGNALITKYLVEHHPGLNVPKLHLMTKGTKLLLDAYPDGYEWIRSACKERLEEEAV